MTLGAGPPDGPARAARLRRARRRRRRSARRSASRHPEPLTALVAQGALGQQERARLLRLRGPADPGRRAMSPTARPPHRVLDERRARRAGRRVQGPWWSTWVEVDPADRVALRALSGQDLVPVLERRRRGRHRLDGDPAPARGDRAAAGAVAARSAARAVTDLAIAWFNDVWKLAPNAIDDELAARRARTPRGSPPGAPRSRRRLPWFEALLERPRLPARRRARSLRRLRLPVPEVRPRRARRGRRGAASTTSCTSTCAARRRPARAWQPGSAASTRCRAPDARFLKDFLRPLEGS